MSVSVLISSFYTMCLVKILSVILFLNLTSADIFSLKLQNQKDSIYAVHMSFGKDSEGNLTTKLNLRAARNSTELVGYLSEYNDEEDKFFKLNEAEKIDVEKPFAINADGLKDIPTYAFNPNEEQRASNVRYILASRLMNISKELQWRAKGGSPPFMSELNLTDIELSKCSSNVHINSTEDFYNIYIHTNLVNCAQGEEDNRSFTPNSAFTLNLMYTKPEFKLVDYVSHLDLMRLDTNPSLDLVETIQIKFEQFVDIQKNVTMREFEHMSKTVTHFVLD